MTEIENVLHEDRTFPPTDAFRKASHLGSVDAYDPAAAKATHEAQLEKWKVRAEKAKAEGQNAPRRPQNPK